MRIGWEGYGDMDAHAVHTLYLQYVKRYSDDGKLYDCCSEHVGGKYRGNTGVGLSSDILPIGVTGFTSRKYH